MTVPSAWQFLLLAAAAWRTYHLIAFDSILDGPRNRIAGLPWNWKDGDPVPTSYRRRLGDFIQCPYCAGFWTGMAWWGFWIGTEEWSVKLAVPWALSAALVVIHAWLDRD